MSENQSPVLTAAVQEVQAHFASDAALQDALSQLTLNGYDRADLSLPQEQRTQHVQTPNEGAENPVDHIDRTQLRTMGTSMAGYAGAVVAAGATLATGGAAAVAVAAAAAVGAGGAMVANAAGQAAERIDHEQRDERGRAGTLILAVRVTDAAQADAATAIMRQAGATQVNTINRGEDMLTRGVSAASWTGG
jgi:hypothetical protein